MGAPPPRIAGVQDPPFFPLGGGTSGGNPGQPFTLSFHSGVDGAPDGTTDPNNLGSNNGTTYGPAQNTSNGAYVVLPGTSYINTGDNSSVQDFFYKPSTSIFIPSNATNAQLSGQFYSDNEGYVLLNGSQIATNVGTSEFQGSPTDFSATLTPGTNYTLSFRVTNDGGPTGLDYTATVTYTA